MASKERLDVLLFKKGLCTSRSKAKRVIMSGVVYVNGNKEDKAGTRVPVDSEIEIRGDNSPYVSRGGIKLEHAIDVFKLNVEGKTAVDIGASTGGFTDCTLKRGAAHVWAVDVGYGQLDWNLRNNSQVTPLENKNARYLKVEDIGQKVDMATVDVSFISLKKILPPLLNIVKEDGYIISLIKPQFEAGPNKVGKGGIVKDPSIHLEVLSDIADFIMDEINRQLLNMTYSPITGSSGNIEYFVLIRNVENDGADIDIENVVDSAWGKLSSEEI